MREALPYITETAGFALVAWGIDGLLGIYPAAIFVGLVLVVGSLAAAVRSSGERA